MGRVGVIRFSQLSRPCPSGHRLCLSASCWLMENEISYAIRLEAGYQLTAIYREGMDDPIPTRKAFFKSQWAKRLRRE